VPGTYPASLCDDPRPEYKRSYHRPKSGPKTPETYTPGGAPALLSLFSLGVTSAPKTSEGVATHAQPHFAGFLDVTLSCR